MNKCEDKMASFLELINRELIVRLSAAHIERRHVAHRKSSEKLTVPYLPTTKLVIVNTVEHSAANHPDIFFGSPSEIPQQR